jgi:hypothetical protein
MSMRRGRVLPDHQPVHLHPKHGPGIARRFGLNHDPLDHRPARRHLSARNARPRASASEIFPGEDFEGASRQLDRQNNIVIGGKQKRGRPLYREIEGLHVAIGFNRVGGHVVGASRYMRGVKK